jgi:hypothetical protein
MGRYFLSVSWHSIFWTILVISQSTGTNILELYRDNDEECAGVNTMPQFRPSKTAVYIRVPKTGSSSALKVITTEACYRDKVATVDHASGCNILSRCNASCFAAVPMRNLPVVAVIREPCERFLGIVAHVRASNQPGACCLQLHNLSFAESVESLLQFYRKSGCARNPDPTCLVHYINRVARLWTNWVPRVLFFPQAFYVHTPNQPTRVEAICSKGRTMDVLPELTRRLSQITGCPASNTTFKDPQDADYSRTINVNSHEYPHVYSPTTCREIRSLMYPDTVMWDSRCGRLSSAPPGTGTRAA